MRSTPTRSAAAVLAALALLILLSVLPLVLLVLLAVARRLRLGCEALGLRLLAGAVTLGGLGGELRVGDGLLVGEAAVGREARDRGLVDLDHDLRVPVGEGDLRLEDAATDLRHLGREGHRPRAHEVIRVDLLDVVAGPLDHHHPPLLRAVDDRRSRRLERLADPIGQALHLRLEARDVAEDVDLDRRRLLEARVVQDREVVRVARPGLGDRVLHLDVRVARLPAEHEARRPCLEVPGELDRDLVKLPALIEEAVDLLDDHVDAPALAREDDRRRRGEEPRELGVDHPTHEGVVAEDFDLTIVGRPDELRLGELDPAADAVGLARDLPDLEPGRPVVERAESHAAPAPPGDLHPVAAVLAAPEVLLLEHLQPLGKRRADLDDPRHARGFGLFLDGHGRRERPEDDRVLLRLAVAEVIPRRLAGELHLQVVEVEKVQRALQPGGRAALSDGHLELLRFLDLLEDAARRARVRVVRPGADAVAVPRELQDLVLRDRGPVRVVLVAVPDLRPGGRLGRGDDGLEALEGRAALLGGGVCDGGDERGDGVETVRSHGASEGMPGHDPALVHLSGHRTTPALRFARISGRNRQKINFCLTSERKKSSFLERKARGRIPKSEDFVNLTLYKIAK